MQNKLANKKQSESIILNSLGIGLFCLYVFMSYLGNDVILPASISSLMLYLFLGYSALFVLVKSTIKLNIQIVWMAVFMVVSGFTMLYSEEKGVFTGTYYFLIVNIVLVFLLSQYSLNKKNIEIIFWAYAVSSLALVILLIVTGNIVDNSETGRLGTELTGNANNLATMLMVSAIYTVWLLVYGEKGIIKKIILAVSLVSQYFAMFLSGGRKYIFIPLILLYILLVFKQDKNGRKHTIIYTAVIIAVAIIVWFLIMNVEMFYEMIGYRIEEFIDFMSGDMYNTDYSTQIRSTMIEAAFKAWVESPVWGYGFDSFRVYNITITGYDYYSHNNFAELLYNEGIIGFIAYYWFYIKVLVKVKKEKENLPIYAKAFATATVISLLVFEIGAVDYTVTVIMILLFMVFALLNLNECEPEQSDEFIEATKENGTVLNNDFHFKKYKNSKFK